MGAVASQITSITIVYSMVYSGADQKEYQSSASLAFVQGIHRWPVNSPHKWPVTRKMFPFDDRHHVIPEVSWVRHAIPPMDRYTSLTQRTHDVIITALLRRNDVATSFWRNKDVVITSCARRVPSHTCQVTLDISGGPIESQWGSRKYPG